jgi:hypothetical protein
MTTITITKSQGYTGNGSAYAKGYVAMITGLDSRYVFARQFIPGQGDQPRKPKAYWEETHYIGEGLYEVSEGGKKTYRIVRVKGASSSGARSTETAHTG